MHNMKTKNYSTLAANSEFATQGIHVGDIEFKGLYAQQMANHFVLYSGKEAYLRTKLLGKPATFMSLWR